MHQTSIVIKQGSQCTIPGLKDNISDMVIFLCQKWLLRLQDLSLANCRSRSISSLNFVRNSCQLSRYIYEHICKTSKVYFIVYLHLVLKPDKAPFLKILKDILLSKGLHQHFCCFKISCFSTVFRTDLDLDNISVYLWLPKFHRF